MSDTESKEGAWKLYILNRLIDDKSNDRNGDFIATVYALGLIKLEEINCEVKNEAKTQLHVSDVRSKVESASKELRSASDEFGPAWADSVAGLTALKITEQLPSFWIGVSQGVIGTFLAGIIAFLFIIAAPHLVDIAKNISGDVSRIFNGAAAEGCASKESPNC